MTTGMTKMTRNVILKTARKLHHMMMDDDVVVDDVYAADNDVTNDVNI